MMPLTLDLRRALGIAVIFALHLTPASICRLPYVLRVPSYDELRLGKNLHDSVHSHRRSCNGPV